MQDLHEIIKLILRPRVAFSAWVTGIVVLAVPLPEMLKLDTLRDTYGGFIGLATLFAFVVWIVEVGFVLTGWAVAHWKPIQTSRVFRDTVFGRLDCLNDPEITWLWRAVVRKRQVVRCNPALHSELTVLMSYELVEMVDLEHCKIPDAVWFVLTKNRDKFLEVARVKSPSVANSLKASEMSPVDTPS